MSQPGDCLEWVIRLTAVSTAVAAAELLVAAPLFAEDRIMGWTLLKRRSRLGGDGLVSRALDRAFRWPGIIILFWIWLAVAVGLGLAPRHPVWRPVALFILFVIQLLLNLRHFGVGIIGGDRLRLVLLGALTLREIIPASDYGIKITLLFIGANCTLAYFVAGIYHLPIAEWRSGTALTVILRHPRIGDPSLAGWLTRHVGVGRLLTWAVLVLEVGFPLALLGGAHTIVPALVATLLMHLAIGHLMGLSRFVWAFLAAYPAVIYTSEQVRDWLFH